MVCDKWQNAEWNFERALWLGAWNQQKTILYFLTPGTPVRAPFEITWLNPFLVPFKLCMPHSSFRNIDFPFIVDEVAITFLYSTWITVKAINAGGNTSYDFKCIVITGVLTWDKAGTDSEQKDARSAPGSFMPELLFCFGRNNMTTECIPLLWFSSPYSVSFSALYQSSKALVFASFTIQMLRSDKILLDNDCCSMNSTINDKKLYLINQTSIE